MATELSAVSAAYGARADEYIEAVGRLEHVDAADLALVEGWARAAEGRVLDVGCGPGQWTAHLAALGLDARGIDPCPEFVERARASHPGVGYSRGQAEHLGVEHGSLGGVLAWFSLIHTEPEAIAAPLDEFARCLRPGGGLALGFFAAARLEPFDHAIATAWAWPVDLLASRVETAGFVVDRVESRAGAPGRTLAAILATRSGTVRDERAENGDGSQR